MPAPVPAGTGSAPAISFRGVTKYFASGERGRLEVLRDVSFEVGAPRDRSDRRPSGSGKSTLLNIAAGLIMPDAGHVSVMGQDTAAAVDWGCVGYMFQDDRLLPWRVPGATSRWRSKPAACRRPSGGRGGGVGGGGGGGAGG